MFLKELQLLMTSIIADWTTSTSDWERNTMLKIAKCGRNLSLRCFAAVTGFIIFSLYFYVPNVIKNIHQPHRNLIFRMDNIQKSPAYEIIFLIQVFGGIYSILGNYAVDSFVSILVLHICAQLINLRLMLNNLVNELPNKPLFPSSFKKGLAAIVVRHEHLIRYVGKFLHHLIMQSFKRS